MCDDSVPCYTMFSHFPHFAVYVSLNQFLKVHWNTKALLCLASIFGTLANSADPDQMQLFCGIWSGSTLFAYRTFCSKSNKNENVHLAPLNRKCTVPINEDEKYGLNQLLSHIRGLVNKLESFLIKFYLRIYFHDHDHFLSLSTVIDFVIFCFFPQQIVQIGFCNVRILSY